MSAHRLRVQRKPFDTLTAAENAGWARLLRESATSRWAFLSPTYAEAATITLGPVDVLLFWQSDELVGVMPFSVRAAGWGVWACESRWAGT